MEISASRQRVGQREIAGFSARQSQGSQEENLTPPAGLKPVEQEAWLAMARQHAASELTSFYPARYDEPFVVENQGVRVAVRPVDGSDVGAQIENGQVIYREAYRETNSVHLIGGGRSEEFLYLQSECAPREFAYEISEVSPGTRVKVVNGEVRFTNKLGQGVKIEAPWLIEASGKSRTDAVHWELDASKSAAGPQQLRLVVAQGLRYPVVIDPSWTATGSMGNARELHTATLLPTGKVLVAGGNGNIGTAFTAELYDPATGTWAPTGGLNTFRYWHTATLLPSGKVLIAGGTQDGFNGLIGAELYNPATGTWSGTGTLATGRLLHTATLLPSGKVLVTGGDGGSGPLSSAELYDPATGTWSAAGNLGTARRLHTATLLSSGKVLVAAGLGTGIPSALSSAALYDPATGTWASTGNLVTSRSETRRRCCPGQVLARRNR